MNEENPAPSSGRSKGESEPEKAAWNRIGDTMSKAIELEFRGYRKADAGYQPEPDIHDIEMVGSELWIKDKE